MEPKTFTREEIIGSRSLRTECERAGLTFKKIGAELYARCPFHNDQGKPNFRFNEKKDCWTCDVCNTGGGVVEFVALRTGKTPKDVFKEWAVELSGDKMTDVVKKLGRVKEDTAPPKGNIVATYDYLDEKGQLAYQVVRLEPKSFRQRHKNPKGEWVWNMEGVTRLLYRLPEVIANEQVWICYTPDTEVLTESGWIQFPKLTTKHKVARYSSGQICFEKPSRVQCLNFNGLLVQIDTTFCQLHITPQHRMLIRRTQQDGTLGNPATIMAAELIAGHAIPVSGMMTSGRSPLTIDQIRLLCAFAADANICTRDNGLRWDLMRKRKIDRLKLLLNALGIPFKKYHSKRGSTLISINRNDASWILDWMPDKKWSFKHLSLDLPSRQAIIEELGEWDGHKNNYGSIKFDTTREDEANAIAAIAVTSGYCCSINTVQRPSPRQTIYSLSILFRSWKRIGRNPRLEKQKAITQQSYSGPVYCCTTSSGFIVVRRNGKIVISGNCEGERDSESLRDLGYTATTNTGGAGKWLEAYNEHLKGKDVIVCPDNDEPGRKHADTIIASIKDHAKSVKLISLPPPYKDVTDFISFLKSQEFDTQAIRATLDIVIQEAPVVGGFTLIPVKSLYELETEYSSFTDQSYEFALNLGNWLPGLGAIRPIVPGELITILADTGTGKCLGKGTKVLMFDGSTRNVEDIMTGDLLMGPDSKPRTVLSTATGQEEMFLIQPRNGDAFTCNRSHILNLKSTGVHSSKPWKGGDVINLSVDDYLQKPKGFKHVWKLWKTGVEFPKAKLPIPPYILGLWLGDGSLGKPEITTPDPEIKAAISEYAKSIGLTVRIDKGRGCETIAITNPNQKKTSEHCSIPGCGRTIQAKGLCHNHYNVAHYNGDIETKRNPFSIALKQLGIYHEKRIPDIYLRSSKAQRLQLLAGLVDSDGYCPRPSSCEIASVSKHLANDYLFLARSLGFLCSLKIKEVRIKSIRYAGKAYRLNMSGDIRSLPTKVPRRRPTGNVLRTFKLSSFTATSIGQGQYYGFQLSGDGLFLLADFTVTHNTGILQNIAAYSAITTLLFELELPATLMFERFLGILTGFTCEQIELAYRCGHAGTASLSKLDHVFCCNESGLTILDLHRLITQSALKIGKPPALVIIDYMQLVASPDTKTRYERVASTAEALKVLAKKTNTIIISASQVGRKDYSKEGSEIIHLHDAKNAGEIENSSGLVIGAWRDPDNQKILNLRILKNTKGKSGLLVRCDFDGQTMRITQRSVHYPNP